VTVQPVIAAVSSGAAQSCTYYLEVLSAGFYGSLAEYTALACIPASEHIT
jgi:hypothetical protein